MLVPARPICLGLVIDNDVLLLQSLVNMSDNVIAVQNFIANLFVVVDKT